MTSRPSAPIPAVPLWGKETALAIENFTVSGRALPIAIIRALASIKAEAASANAELEDTGIDGPMALAIVEAATAIERSEHDEQFPIDVFQTGSGTSSNMNVNEVIATIATTASGLTVHPNDHVNASQSSNDVFPSAVAIAALVGLASELRPAAMRLAASLDQQADRFASVVKPGRTHMMDAVPITLGDEMAGYAAQVREAVERLDDCVPRLGRIPLGGTAVGTGLNAPPRFAEVVVRALAARLGIGLSVAPNRFAAQSSRDPLVEASAQLRGLAIALIKIANDVRLMASGPAAGLGELTLPTLQAGSSIMPGKVNPVMCEMVTQVGAQVIGNDAAVAFAGSQGAFELNTYQPVMAVNVLDSISLLARACDLFRERCVEGLGVDEDKLRRVVESTPAVAAGLNQALGYDRVAALAARAEREGRPLIDVVIDDGALDEASARRILDVDRLARGNRHRP